MLIDEVASGNMRVYKDGQYIDPMTLQVARRCSVSEQITWAVILERSPTRDVGALDVFSSAADYHSHLGTRRGGMVVYEPEDGFSGRSTTLKTPPSARNLKGAA